MIGAMDGLNWTWAMALALGALLIFRIGFGIGRLTRGGEDIRPIDTGRISPAVRLEIGDALRRGRKIEAIKLLRKDTGCGLAEAKHTIEAMMP